MKTLILALLLSASSLSFAQSALFHGRVELEQTLSERMLAKDQFSFARYFKSMGYETANGLLALLGRYNSLAGQSTFENGQANSVNMLLYDLVLDALAQEIRNGCTASTGLNFNSDFRTALDGICQWPAAQAQSEDVMKAFWLALMSYDAPESEFEAWRDFFTTSSFASQPASVAVSAMTFAILYNPNFLLKR